MGNMFVLKEITATNLTKLSNKREVFKKFTGECLHTINIYL